MKLKNCLIKWTVLSMIVATASQVNAAPEEKYVNAADIGKPAFRDIPKGHWAEEAASKLLGAGILEGNKRDELRGNDYMTRYEFAISMIRWVNRTVCVLPPPPDELVYAKKNDLSQVLERLDAIESRLKTLEAKVDAGKAASTDQLSPQKELVGLKNEVSNVAKELVQQIKNQTP